MATKMTAVQWLEIAVQNKLKAEMGPYFAEVFQQAKAMEKEQIMDAYNDGSAEWTDIEYTDAEQYYNETYNQ